MTELEEAPEFARRVRGWGSVPGAQTLTMADLVRAGSGLGDAIAGHRVVGREDRALLAALSVALLTAALLSALLPRWVAWTAAVIMAWLGGVLAVRGVLQFLKARGQARRASRSGYPGGDDPRGARSDGDGIHDSMRTEMDELKRTEAP